MLNIILFGPPYAGKGTQSQNIIEKYGLIHLSTGDLLRAEMKEGTELGKSAQKLINDGLLVPDEVVIGMINNKIKSNKSAKGFIFDGFPRTVPQAGALDHLCVENGITIDAVIGLTVEKDELTKRAVLRGQTSNRADDKDPVVISKRIVVYQEETAPVADYYRKKGIYKEVDGMNSIEQVFKDISKILDLVKQ
ncbi:MAG: adenylate kinase [Sporocytophaga sp.]|uniref:adenylate kinase n=1 Tax=Sporocytophaga sp. TaxID=2231183 RepID=UPI001B1CB2E9|nr:adenylate kinase [Sporocytophaga sp.]MBO9701658.1 adenylate kinase [Sporocytophaga sp.]